MRGQVKMTYRFSGAKKLSGEYLFSRSRTTTGTTTRSAAWATGRSSQGAVVVRAAGFDVHLLQRAGASSRTRDLQERPVQDGLHASAVERLVHHRSAFGAVRDNKLQGRRSKDKDPSRVRAVQRQRPRAGSREPVLRGHAVTIPVWEDRRSQPVHVPRRLPEQDRRRYARDQDGHDTSDYFDLFKKDARTVPGRGRSGRELPEPVRGDRARRRVLRAGPSPLPEDDGHERRGSGSTSSIRARTPIRVTNQRVLALEKPTEGTSRSWSVGRRRCRRGSECRIRSPTSDVLHFHYGRFFQLPDLEFLYDYSNDAAAGQPAGRQRVPGSGDHHLLRVRRAPPAFGLHLFLDATVFFKDIFGLVGTKELEPERRGRAEPVRAHHLRS